METVFLELTWGEMILVFMAQCLVYMVIPCVVVFVVVKTTSRRAWKKRTTMTLNHTCGPLSDSKGDAGFRRFSGREVGRA